MAKKRRRAALSLLLDDHYMVPNDAGPLFHILWQLEAWFREIVYVELRGTDLNWTDALPKDDANGRRGPADRQAKDRKQSHMTTVHQNPLSYLTLGELWDVMRAKLRWPLFAPYFPPQDNTEARIKEIATIRNRVMHFRRPHADDLARVRLFAKDFQTGLRRFVTDYNSPLYTSVPDPFESWLKQHWNDVGYGVEAKTTTLGWLYAPGQHRERPRLHARVELLRKGFAKGVVPQHRYYRITIDLPVDRGRLNHAELLRSTSSIHKHCIHVMLLGPGYGDAAIVLSDVIGHERMAELTDVWFKAGLECAMSADCEPTQFDAQLIRNQPEYVIQPDNPLGCYDDETPGELIDIAERRLS